MNFLDSAELEPGAGFDAGLRSGRDDGIRSFAIFINI